MLEHWIVEVPWYRYVCKARYEIDTYVHLAVCSFSVVYIAVSFVRYCCIAVEVLSRGVATRQNRSVGYGTGRICVIISVSIHSNVAATAQGNSLSLIARLSRLCVNLVVASHRSNIFSSVSW